MTQRRTHFLVLAGTALMFPAVAGDLRTTIPNATNRFTITGMHCDGCAGGLQAELKLVPGVIKADVSFSNKLAVVTFDTNLVSTAKLTATVKEAGFTAKPVTP